MADGQVVFEITADGKRAIANVKDITAAIQSESKKWDRAADDSADNMEDSFLTMAKNIAAGLAASKVASVILIGARRQSLPHRISQRFRTL